MISKSLYKILGVLLMIGPILGFVGLIIYSAIEHLDFYAGREFELISGSLLGLLSFAPQIIIGFIIGIIYMRFAKGRLITTKTSDWSVIFAYITLLGALLINLAAFILFAVLDMNGEGALGLAVISGLILWATGLISLILLIVGLVKSHRLKKQASIVPTSIQ